MTQIHGVLLDIDGTLVDSNDAHASAWVEALKEHGYDVPFERIRPLIGMGGDRVLPETIGVEKDSSQGKQISKRRQAIFKERYLPTLHAFPGSKALLEAMRKRGLKLGVASSAEPDEAKALLAIVGAGGLIDIQTTSKDVEHSKPSPDVMQVALQRLGLSPDEVLLLGDTAYDIEAAKKAGVETIALRSGGWKDTDLAKAKAIYNDPADLLAHYETSPLAQTNTEIEKREAMSNPLLQLKPLGQSLWYDNIDRAQLISGQFQRLLDEDGVLGVTDNPTTFEKAMKAGKAYDEQIRQLIREGKNAKEVCETLVTTDIRTVAEMLRPLYDSSGGQDGYVSLEVSPELAYDTRQTIEETRRFWKMIARPNLMIKIPATPQGIPAIRQALTEGINVNVTLIFSISDYHQVAEAYLSALEARVRQGQDIKQIASVASFFVSRLDVLVDSLIEEKLKTIQDSAERERLSSLAGKAAIANARLVYKEFRQIFSTPRFASLARKGGKLQRPLWASTSTKNPAYRDVLYAEELIGPNTVDTMPLETIEHFRDHGRVHLSIENELPQATEVLKALEQAGISYKQVTQQLQEEGVQKFADSFSAMYQGAENKLKAIQA